MLEKLLLFCQFRHKELACCVERGIKEIEQVEVTFALTIVDETLPLNSTHSLNEHMQQFDPHLLQLCTVLSSKYSTMTENS